MGLGCKPIGVWKKRMKKVDNEILQEKQARKNKKVKKEDVE